MIPYDLTRISTPIKVSTYIDLNNMPLHELRAQVDKWITLYGAEAELVEYQDSYDDGWYWAISKLMPETNAEYAARRTAATLQQAIAEEMELAEFKRLSEKYTSPVVPK